MGFIKSIFGEINHLIIDLIGSLFINSIGDAAGNPFGLIAVHETLALLLHDIALFLGHGAPQQVASSQRVSCQIPHNLHDLLLVDDAAIGRGKNRLQLGAVISDVIHMVLALDILRYEIHRARTV